MFERSSGFGAAPPTTFASNPRSSTLQFKADETLSNLLLVWGGGYDIPWFDDPIAQYFAADAAVVPEPLV